MTDLNDLAKRVETEEPSRELADEVLLACKVVPPDVLGMLQGLDKDRPNPLTSLDAAAALVPEGQYDQSWCKSERGKDTWKYWTLWQVRISLETIEEDPDETCGVALGCANTAAQALTAAALRAMAAGEGEDG